MKAELKEITLKDLEERLSDEKQKLDNLRFQHSVSGLESPIQISRTRKNIARILTELNGRNK